MILRHRVSGKAGASEQRPSRPESFMRRNTLGNPIVLAAVSVASTALLLFTSPAGAQESGTCSARVVRGDVGERHSLKTSGGKLSSLTLRFRIPVEGSHGELSISGPLADGLVSMDEGTRFSVLGNNLAKGRQMLASSRSATFTCVGADAPVRLPTMPAVPVSELVSGANKRLKTLSAMRKRSGVRLKTSREVGTFISKRGPLRAAIRRRDAKALQAAIGQADAHVRAMESEIEASERRMKSLALDTASQLREAASELPDGREKSSAFRLASSLESRARSGTATESMVSSAERAIAKVRRSAEASRAKAAAAKARREAAAEARAAAEEKARADAERRAAAAKARSDAEKARRDAAEKARADAAASRAAAEKARREAEDARRAEARRLAAAKGTMKMCKGDFDVRVRAGRGPVKGYPVSIPLRLVVEERGSRSKVAKSYPITAVLDLDVGALRPDSVDATSSRAGKLIGSELQRRCPAGDDQSFGVIHRKVGATIKNLRNKVIDSLDRQISKGDSPEHGLLLKVRRFLAGRSKVEEDAAIERAKRKAGIR